MLPSVLESRKSAEEARGGGLVAVIVLGDLNARKGNFGPTDKGRPPQAAYRLFRDGAIDADDVDWEFSLWRPDEWKGGPCDVVVESCICCRDLGVVEGYGVCPLCDGLGVDQIQSEAENARAPASQKLLRLNLQSPLPLTDPNGHVKVTNFTGSFQECIDYTLLDARA